ncbi:MAG TPA: sigma-70 family RNA polymerase sigma factor [Chloroflexota bacterium]|nr:sigma-70 family RNA polymerase sigma factor [Chloroflexota bacterium]
MRSRADTAISDDEFVAGCVRGEQAAWDGLIDRYAALIYSIPLKYGFSEADAADVFQSVCLILLEKLESVRAPRGLAAWIITTTSRECLAVVRKQRREHGVSAGGGGSLEAATELVDPRQLPEEEVLSLERQHLVRTAVSQLPDNCRRLVEAFFSDAANPDAAAVKGTSYQQLANSLGVPVNSLGPTRSRCLEKLRRLLRAAGYVP